MTAWYYAIGSLLIKIHENEKTKSDVGSLSVDNGNGKIGIKGKNINKGALSGGFDFIKTADIGERPQSLLAPACLSVVSSPEQTPISLQMKWQIHSEQWNSESGTGSAEKEYNTNIRTPPTHHDMLPLVAIGSPAQSDVPTLTSWDEWDRDSESVWQFDPMAAIGDGVVVHYDSLL